MNSLTESVIGTAYLSIASFFSLKLYVHSPGSDVNIFILHNDVIYILNDDRFSRRTSYKLSQ